jgi:hypothetical protein
LESNSKPLDLLWRMTCPASWTQVAGWLNKNSNVR